MACTPPSDLPKLGALENAGALANFFDAIDANGQVRIAQLGDSHTQFDHETGTVRRTLQARFGDGGRGFVPLGMPIAGWAQERVTVESVGWSPEMSPLGPGRLPSTGIFGLLGVAMHATAPDARAWTEVSGTSKHMELDYLEQPGGGSFEVLVDKVSMGTIATAAPIARSAYRGFDVPEGPHRIEIRSAGDNDVRVFGVAFERSQRGIVLDALGIKGARVPTLLSWDETHWGEQVSHRDPALVILAYGTNDSVDVEVPPAEFQAELVEAIGRVKKAVPRASCLVLGPPDRAIMIDGEWKTAPKILEIVDSERKVAIANGCAFFDRMGVMGGAGSIVKWANMKPPYAPADHVHLTPSGYASIGTQLAIDLIRAYETRPPR
jgi:lysophospholipase L1-like esterase